MFYYRGFILCKVSNERHAITEVCKILKQFKQLWLAQLNLFIYIVSIGVIFLFLFCSLLILICCFYNKTFLTGIEKVMIKTNVCVYINVYVRFLF